MILPILKTAGLILLLAAGAALAVVCLVLFVPVRYTADAEYNGEMRFRAEASWLFRLARFFFINDGEINSSLKILGFRIKKSSSESNKDSKESENLNNDTEIKTSKKIQNKTRREKISLSERVSDFAATDDKFEIIKQAWICLKRLLKALRPRKIRGRLVLAFADPSLTGILLGAACAVIYPLNLNGLFITGNFESGQMSADLHIAGRLSLWSVIWPLAAFAISKPVWPLTAASIFKKGDTNERKSE